jgi:two-component system response regulator GlrR
MAERPRVLLVDDDPALLRVLALRLTGEGYSTETAAGGNSALGKLTSFRPHVVITDLRMKGMDGMSLFDVIRSRDATLPVVMLTGHGSVPDAVDATRRGLFAYLTKPFEKGHLLDTIARAANLTGAHSAPSGRDDNWSQQIITRSATMEGLLRDAWLVSQSDASVLICGQSGTGKELLANAIHKASHRASGPFVAINCTAIPETLFEAELFGHKKGAFTGATHSRTGLLETANEGTVFLDEIGDMPMPFQAKLLRMLQEREIRPVGCAESVPINVRIISATHQNLERAVLEKRFRADLYYRLDVVKLEIPPLAARREDIPLLARHFLGKAHAKSASSDSPRRIKSFSNDAMELMLAADWPGNVRQLQNVVEQCIALSTTSYVSATLVERALKARGPGMPSFACARDTFEQEYLAQVLSMTEGNVAQAARLARKNRSEFYRLLNKHKLTPESFRSIACESI